jgi:hypothetical protein
LLLNFILHPITIFIRPSIGTTHPTISNCNGSPKWQSQSADYPLMHFNQLYYQSSALTHLIQHTSHTHIPDHTVPVMTPTIPHNQNPYFPHTTTAHSTTTIHKTNHHNCRTNPTTPIPTSKPPQQS